MILSEKNNIIAIRRRVGTYSKGMRQKVGIAIAVAKHAKILLLDEPTSGLDPKASNEFSELLLQLSAQGTAILWPPTIFSGQRKWAPRWALCAKAN